MTLLLSVSFIALLGLSAWQAYENDSLTNKLERCGQEKRSLKADVAIHHAKVSELLGAIAEQNAEVKRISEYSDALALEAAMQELQFIEVRVKRKENVEELKAEIGQSCAQGINLIDKELELI